MNNIVIGQFVPGNSIIHRMDARLKIILSFIFIVLMLFTKSVYSYVLAILAVAVVIKLTKQPLKLYLKGIKGIAGLLIFTLILQMIFTPGEPVLFSFAFIKVTYPGVINAGLIFIRFILIILMSTTLTLATSPNDIANGIEDILKPLKIFKVPVAEFALILSIALRFVPLLMMETTKIMNAQKSRGMDFNSGGIIKRAKALIPLLIPLFVGALNRAMDLANAMEVRGFKDAEQRTKYRQLKLAKLDYIAIVVSVVFSYVFFIIR